MSSPQKKIYRGNEWKPSVCANKLNEVISFAIENIYKSNNSNSSSFHTFCCAAADPVHGAADEPDPGRAAGLRPRPPHGRAGRPAERLEDGPTRLRGHRLRAYHPR